MEVLYAIISILFILSVIVLLVLLFRNKKTDPVNGNGRGFGTKVNQVFGGKNAAASGRKQSAEYRLEPGSRESINETLRDTALNVVITNVRDPKVREICYIQDDDALSREGVIIGRENCDYNMNSLLIDREGTFLIKRVGDSFVLIANRDSVNGIRSEFHGEKQKKIEFVDGRATCYVGSIRFDFCMPEYEDFAASRHSHKPRFYSDDTFTEGTKAYSLT